MAPSTALTISPSKLDRIILCPGSARMNVGVPWKDSPAAARGRALHDAMALLLQAGPKAWASVKVKVASNPHCKDGDVRALEQAYEWIMECMPADPDTVVIIERQLNLGPVGLSTEDAEGNKRGLCDVIFISPKFKQAVVADYKFGATPVPDPQVNWQMRSYGVGLMLTLPELAKEFPKLAGLELEAVEAVIIQPGAQRQDDCVRSGLWQREELRNLAREIQGYAAKAKEPNAPIIANLAEQCRFCGAKDKCEEYRLAAKAKVDRQEEQQQQAIAQVTTMGTPVTVEMDEPLAFPLIIVNAETVALAKQKRDLILGMTVTDQASAEAMGQACKDARALNNLIEKNREAMKAPVLKLGRMIDEAAKTAQGPLSDAATHGDNSVRAWLRMEEEKARKKREEEEAKQRAAEEAARKAREEQERKEREAAEAVRQAQLASERAASLKTKEAREKAEALAREQAAKAAAAQRAAEEEARKREAAELEARQAEVAQVGEAPAKVTGFRQTTEVTWEIVAYDKIPVSLLAVVLVPDKKVIDTMIKGNKLTEANAGAWLTIKREAGVARSAR